MVVRHGSLDNPLTFHYSTVDGVAKKNLHFYAKSESARFASFENEKIITIQLVEDSEWRPGSVFYVQLKLDPHSDEEGKETKLGKTYIAHVCRLSNSSSFTGESLVEFTESNYVVRESEGYVRVFITRRGRYDRSPFVVNYETFDVSARSGVDYASVHNGVVKFMEDEFENEMNDTLDITIGPRKRTVVTILCDDNFIRNIFQIRKLTFYYFNRMSFGAKTWLEQIACAVSVNEGDIANATLIDCLLHALSFPWKITFAFIPPPMLLGGWPCFFVGLVLIGVVTAVIGDLASIFGCMVGLKDSITAITFVALGTSLPDTFASKIAAQNDDTADNAIGNVTGSNCVNVFLGLGLPWLIAALYWYSKKQSFVVSAGNLGFSVAVFMTTSILCLGLLMMRRYLAVFGKGELGGPISPKVLSAVFLFFLWLFYVVVSALQAYKVINF
ncbi:unnamed protein product [Enterobius vermicularis]|uniref:Calx-beta domain-containing protein n=1 Tax=Enterobius vermicularis TaxID=51028 RepID=A0A0N4VB32_ENTVE|nr:unnamed protein product [Enterobius vermicularis]